MTTLRDLLTDLVDEILDEIKADPTDEELREIEAIKEAYIDEIKERLIG